MTYSLNLGKNNSRLIVFHLWINSITFGNEEKLWHWQLSSIQRNKVMTHKLFSTEGQFAGNDSDTWASSFFHFKGRGEVLLWDNSNEAVQFSYPPAVHIILLKNEKRMVTDEIWSCFHKPSHRDGMGDSIDGFFVGICELLTPLMGSHLHLHCTLCIFDAIAEPKESSSPPFPSKQNGMASSEKTGHMLNASTLMMFRDSGHSSNQYYLSSTFYVQSAIWVPLRYPMVNQNIACPLVLAA